MQLDVLVGPGRGSACILSGHTATWHCDDWYRCSQRRRHRILANHRDDFTHRHKSSKTHLCGFHVSGQCQGQSGGTEAIGHQESPASARYVAAEADRSAGVYRLSGR